MEGFAQLGEARGSDNNNSHPAGGSSGFIFSSSVVAPTVPSALFGRNCCGTTDIPAAVAAMQHHQQQHQHHLLPFSSNNNSHHHHPLFHPQLAAASESQQPKPEGSGSACRTTTTALLQQDLATAFSCSFGRRAGGTGAGDMEAIKAKIVSHPQYSSLLEAYMECQKVGAPPEVAARLTVAAREFEARQRSALVTGHEASSGVDPELDQFMEAYYDMLVKYREELARPLQEAMDFLRRVESQLSALTNGAARVFSSDEKCEGVGSSEEDQDASGGETELPEIDPRAEDKELKHHLLKKYSGYLGSLKQELSKKKKKGKLPKEARQKLLNWWELHYKWPYPSETEKVALAESTGLDQKQINNWFINQRKRHWKPSEDMQFVVMDGFHPPNAAALYMDGHHFMGDGAYRFCGL